MDSFSKSSSLAKGDFRRLRQVRCTSEPPSRSPLRNSPLIQSFTKFTSSSKISSSSGLGVVSESEYKEVNTEVLQSEVVNQVKETEVADKQEVEVTFVKNVRDTLSARFLSMIIGCTIYLLVVEQRSLMARIGISSDAMDWIHIGLFVMFPYSIVAISQPLWDFMHNGIAKIFLLFKKGPTSVRVYRLFCNTMHGCAALAASFLSMYACIWWKELENKASCLERVRIGKKAQKICQNGILRMTVIAERYFCENASQMCSKAVYLLPYLLFGGVFILIGTVIAFEYFLAPDITPEIEVKPHKEENGQVLLEEEETETEPNSTLLNQE